MNTLSEPQSPPPAAEPPARAAVTADHLRVLDVWRGVAISLLLLGHFQRHTLTLNPLDADPDVRWGRLGVEFFFVLSGFLMVRLLFIKKTPIKKFYQRRISRIIPAAYLFLLVIYVIYRARGEMSFRSLLPCFLFYINYHVALGLPGGSGPVTSHFWSLAIEEHAYILLSLLALIHRRWGVAPIALLAAALLLCLVSTVIHGVSHDWVYALVYKRSDCRASSIFMGAIAAIAVSQGWGARRTMLGIPSLALGLAATAAGMALHLAPCHDFLKFTLGTALLAVGLLLVSQHTQARSPLLGPLAWIGVVSFSIYLWQQPFSHLQNHEEMNSLLALLGAVAAGAASYYLLERPVRNWLNANWR